MIFQNHQVKINRLLRNLDSQKRPILFKRFDDFVYIRKKAERILKIVIVRGVRKQLLEIYQQQLAIFLKVKKLIKIK